MNDIHDTSLETLKLLKYLIQNNTICTNELNTILNNDKSERSNLRHFKTIQYFFKKEFDIEIFEKISRGCYKIINKDILKQSLDFSDKKELLSYIRILKEILPNYYVKLDNELKKNIESNSKSSKELYHFHNNPLEDFSNNILLKEIEESILKKRKVNFKYKDFNIKDAKPLQIIFMEGNLYLASLTSDTLNDGFKFLRLSYIKDYKVQVNEFNETSNILNAYKFLKEFQTPFSWFNSEYKEVKVLVDFYAKEYFEIKKHLPSQENKILEGGDLQLTFYVTNYLEIVLLVRKWFPHLKIITPLEWKNKFKNEIINYLKDDK
ncbi:WYL domain-containing protein [Poseidonibacter lekithochrous]|uniref:WYL domain-containing protein n=1 Tax=Poseidonibacter TaxID=2321187 RepID=UPI001C08C1CA|nr:MULTISPECIES: WYL domain-containing protein [Poseidonibacter]MBU3014030.1 WYL domain-containing protein [Poseidonibacter lekithochrous]MDO6827326.1 WYL domain-containing protein [Poseidonibacter sp. 1_MG-2023]